MSEMHQVLRDLGVSNQIVETPLQIFEVGMT